MMDKYTDADLIAIYRGCKRPDKQIGILCQLSNKRRSDIVNILVAAGLEVPVKVKRDRRGAWSQEELERLKCLLVQGMTIKEIAHQMDRSASSVRNKATRLAI